MVTTIDDIKLNMFTEEHKIQYLHGIYRKQDRLCSIAFNSELDESFSFKLISDSTYNENWYQIEGEQPTDSVVFWITDSTIYKKDTIKIGWEHNHPHGSKKYIRYVKETSKGLDKFIVVSEKIAKIYFKKMILASSSEKSFQEGSDTLF